jgi:hypothetical protein
LNVLVLVSVFLEESRSLCSVARPSSMNGGVVLTDLRNIVNNPWV